jgi:phosphoenolpyruvate synthase/pyruvate phosphate dikinase
LFKFGTKAETLERLRDLVSKSTICPSVIISANNWIIRQDACIDLIQARFPNDNIIIRSSSVNEDTDVSSMAGIHESHLNVNSQNRQDLIEIFNNVVASYQRVNGKVDALDQVLVQPMITDVSMSGVVFTQDIDTGAPYYRKNGWRDVGQ